VPDLIRARQVEQQRGDHEQVSQKPSDNRRAQEWAVPFPVHDVDDGGHGEPTGGERHAAEDVKPDP
jgi:hypothetical protein